MVCCHPKRLMRIPSSFLPIFAYYQIPAIKHADSTQFSHIPVYSIPKGETR